ncbi:Secretory carrier-associated membrane protein 2 [Asimina triloba]
MELTSEDCEVTQPRRWWYVSGKYLRRTSVGLSIYLHLNPGSVPPATNSRLSPLPPEPADFYYDRGATVDIPLDTSSDLKKKEKELQAKESELRKREEQLKRREEAAARGTFSFHS